VSPKTAEEWREYRRVNQERINENKKRRRLENKESEKLRLMRPLISETAARPAKSEQQSISARERTDNASVAQSGMVSPAEKVAQGWAQVSGMSFVAQVPKQPALWVVPDPVGTIQKAEFEDRKGTNPDPVPEVQEPDSELHKAKNCETLDKDQFAPLVLGKAASPLPMGLVSVVIAVFLSANTYFLVMEQASLYTSLGYSAGMALLIAILTEGALVLLSALASWTPGWIWKAGLYTGCLGIGFVIFCLLNVSVENRATEKTARSEQADMLKKEIRTLEALEGTALATIQNLDPKVYPTKINRLTARLNAPGPDGFTYRLGQLREKLAGLSATGTVQAEIKVLKWQRWASMGWNILLSGFLGFIWSQRKRVLKGAEFASRKR